MFAILNTTPAVLLALAIAALMIAASVFILFYHDRKHEELDQWVDFSFSRDTLRNALTYYRFMAVSMLVFYVLFTISCLLLQAEGRHIFASGNEPLHAGPIAASMFTFDLVLRGGFFDIMEHFDLGVSPVAMNRKSLWFVWYAFVFRMFYALTLIKILISFVWIYGKIRMARQVFRASSSQLRLFE
ncbi:MAG: hypothetical protein KJZ80_16550 [Hyphomicrobiaceae bacterium]|nr:hypothetical protein [Hyphomicrobiaceae bacterium]